MKLALVHGSSTVAALGYDPETLEMQVQFRDGGDLQYAGVPVDTHDLVADASSIGSAVHRHLRDKHKATRISG